MLVELATKSIKRIEKGLKKSKMLFAKGIKDSSKYEYLFLKSEAFELDISSIDDTDKHKEIIKFLKRYKADSKKTIGISEIEYEHEISSESIGEVTANYNAYWLDSLTISYNYYSIVDKYDEELIIKIMKQILVEKIKKNSEKDSELLESINQATALKSRIKRSVKQ